MFLKTIPLEELQNLRTDPHEIHSFARLPRLQEKLPELRYLLDAWITDAAHKGLDSAEAKL